MTTTVSPRSLPLPRTITTAVATVVALAWVGMASGSDAAPAPADGRSEIAAASEEPTLAVVTASPTANATAVPTANATAVPTRTVTIAPTPTGAPVEAAPGGDCERPLTIADVDGDGRDDQIGEGRDAPELVACLATGDELRIEWSGDHGRFGVADVDGDDVPELFFGEDGGFGATVSVARWDGEDLVTLSLDREPLVLRFGTLAFDAGNQPAQTATWGCTRAGTLATVDAFREDVVWEVVTTEYELDGDRLREVDETTTEVEVVDDGASSRAIAPITDPTVLTLRACGDGTAFPSFG